MDAQQIKSIIDAMASSDLAEMEFSQDGWTLRLVRNAGATPANVPRVRPESGRAKAVTSTRPVARDEAPRAADRELRAPLFGVVHLQSSPGEPPFVTSGLAIKAGQTLCVIEAMKVFNEVRADRDATVEVVLVASGQEVEAGQPLLRFV